MGLRVGPGPVFGSECRALARHRVFYLARTVVGAVLLIALAAIWATKFNGRNGGGSIANQRRTLAEAGLTFFETLIGIQVALAMLAAPAVAAGAICNDRARGTLAHVLVTDLSDREIVLGKLAARSLPSFALVACAWPVLALASLLGGMDPVALSLALAVTLAVAALGSAAALALSVWASRPREVLMTVYLGWIALLLAFPIWESSVRGPAPTLLLMVNPFYVALAPYLTPGKLTPIHYLGFFGVVIGLTTALVVLAVRRFRVVTLAFGPGRRASARGRGRLGRFGTILPGPSLDANPILWREWHRNRPTRWGRFIWTGYALFVGLYGMVGIANAMRRGVGWGGENAATAACALAVILGLLLLSTSATASLADERDRRSLELVLATPITTREIVLGKWWGGFRTVLVLAIWPTLLGIAILLAPRAPLPPGVVGLLARRITLPPESPAWVRSVAWVMVPLILLVHGAALTSVGLALATWISRTGRALAAAVGWFVLVGIGWPLFAVTLGERIVGSTVAEGIAGFSPIFAVAGMLDVATVRYLDRWRMLIGWQVVWLVIVAALAAGFRAATLATFDRCLGRVAERPRRPEARQPSATLTAATPVEACL